MSTKLVHVYVIILITNAHHVVYELTFPVWLCTSFNKSDRVLWELFGWFYELHDLIHGWNISKHVYDITKHNQNFNNTRKFSVYMIFPLYTEQKKLGMMAFFSKTICVNLICGLLQQKTFPPYLMKNSCNSSVSYAIPHFPITIMKVQTRSVKSTGY